MLPPSRKKYVLLFIAASIVGAALLLSFQDRVYSGLAGESATIGVVRSVTDTSSNPELPHVAIVKLQDGNEVEATLIPGCNVDLGDTVRVRVLAPLRSEKALYIVVGLARRDKQI
jgi:hypothetical protein